MNCFYNPIIFFSFKYCDRCDFPESTVVTFHLQFAGIVTVDPDVPVDKTLIPSPPTRPKNPVFENEEKSKVSLCFGIPKHRYALRTFVPSGPTNVL